MSNQHERNVGRQYALPVVESDALRHAYTINLHATQDGRLHTMVARMSLTTRKYTFVALPELGLQASGEPSLSQVLHYVANLIACDEELEWFTV